MFVLSGFLDNIAAALIGGTIARHVFKSKVYIGYLVAIVAASNAGGAGSVVGDTTTTMMWIDGVSPLRVVEAYVAAIAGFLVYSIPAAIMQHRHSPIVKDAPHGLHIDWPSVGIVAAILVIAIAANVTANLKFPALLDAMPVLGIAVWFVILATAPLRQPDWAIMPETFKGTVFLLALVTNASFMPVEELPLASWQTALGLGFLSSVFDNIPLTALALKQGGYDWGFLAYSVGFGGSMIWFGSSAGVAISNMYPEAKSVFRWLQHGWFVAVAYVLGFFVMLAILGWKPDPDHKKRVEFFEHQPSNSHDDPARWIVPCRQYRVNANRKRSRARRERKRAQWTCAWRNLESSASSGSGCSTGIMWPVFGMSRYSAPGMSAAISSIPCGRVSTSSCPATTSVGTAMRGRSFDRLKS